MIPSPVKPVMQLQRKPEVVDLQFPPTGSQLLVPFEHASVKHTYKLVNAKQSRTFIALQQQLSHSWKKVVFAKPMEKNLHQKKDLHKHMQK